MDNKYSEKQVESAYRRCYFNGKSRFGRVVDKLLFAFLISVAAYSVSRAFGVKSNGAKFIGIAVGIGFFPAYSAFISIRINGFIEKKRKQLESQIAKRKLLLELENETEESIIRLCTDHPECVFELIKKAAPTDEDDICSAARKHGSSAHKKLVLITLNEPSEKIRAFANGLKDRNIELVLFNEFEVLRNRCQASDDEIAEELIREAVKKPPKRGLPSAEVLLSGAGKYRALGILLFLLSFVMRFSLYLRTLGMLCFLAAFAMGAKERAKHLRMIAD